jgi:SAM-dependent methyltransferase
MHEDLDRQIASSLDADERLLPYLPELLADLDELGTSAHDVLDALRACGLRPGSSVLDLACGKGAVAVALGAELDAQVEGVDAFDSFLASARALAAAKGVDARCRFVRGDVRDRLDGPAAHDAVLLLSVGPIAGDLERTVAGLRTLVRPGGLIAIEDGFLPDEVPAPEGCEQLASLSEARRHLTRHGDELVFERVFSPQATRAMNERNTSLIRARAHRLAHLHPQAADALYAYLAGQERATELLGDAIPCALWVVQKR